MKITRLIVAAVLLAFAGGVASAQQSKSDETIEFKPHWSIGVQGGMGATVGETRFADLLSPAAALNFQWNFHHALGLRLGVGGWQGKGAVVAEDAYAFRFAQLNADLLLDMANLVGGYDHARICIPYVFAGVGGAYGFDNKEAAAFKEKLEYFWESKFFVPVRLGLGVDFRLGDRVTVGLEGNTNILSDRFNSKRADNADWQFNLLAGLKFNLGKSTRPSKAYADKVAAEEAAAVAERAAAEAKRLSDEKAAAEKAAAEKAAAEKAAAEKAAAQKAAAQKAAAERAAFLKANSKDVFFEINSSRISKTEEAKVTDLAEWLKANPGYSVAITGYADKNTGKPEGNMALSQRRVNAVKAMLLKKGVAAERIQDSYKGDTEQPFSVNEQNRVVVCAVK